MRASSRGLWAGSPDSAALPLAGQAARASSTASVALLGVLDDQVEFARRSVFQLEAGTVCPLEKRVDR